MSDGLESDESEHSVSMTLHPRMECKNCGEFVYATRPQDTLEAFWKLECECRIISQDDPEPEVWSRAV